MTTYVLDVETRLLASDVERQDVATLAGDSPWSRPDLFGFAAGVIVDLESGEAQRFGPGEAPEMIAELGRAAVSVGYNSWSFDFGVLSAYGSVETLRQRHVDLCSVVFAALESLASEENIPKRLRHGGLDGLAQANGLGGKSGSGESAPAMYRAGKVEELLTYCEADVWLTAELYKIAREHGELLVKPYHHDEQKNRVELGSRRIQVSLAPAPR